LTWFDKLAGWLARWLAGWWANESLGGKVGIVGR